MECLDLTLDSPAENLACDEVLLDYCENGGAPAGVLRWWQPARHFVVLGYACRIGDEVNRDFCLKNQIPIHRRCSGGGTVLLGPGCFNYSLVLPITMDSALAGISGTNGYILHRLLRALQPLVQNTIQKLGQTDLANGNRKFSGNAQRRKKDFILFHGTFLLNTDLSLMENALPFPPRQPEYRLNRSHADFVMNLGIDAILLKNALAREWNALKQLVQFPFRQTVLLAREKYQQDSWNQKF